MILTAKHRVYSFFAVATLALVALGGCAKQAAGERCDQANADQDCREGLVCTSLAELQSESSIGALCCPPKGISGKEAAGACKSQELKQLDAGGTTPRDVTRFQAALADAARQEAPDAGRLMDADAALDTLLDDAGEVASRVDASASPSGDAALPLQKVEASASKQFNEAGSSDASTLVEQDASSMMDSGVVVDAALAQ